MNNDNTTKIVTIIVCAVVLILCSMLIGMCWEREIYSAAYAAEKNVAEDMNAEVSAKPAEKDGHPLGTLTVSGRGTVKTRPDLASFSFTARETKDTAEEARLAVNERVSAALDILFGTYNLPTADIHTQNIRSFQDYDWVEGEKVINGQCVEQDVHVNVRGDLENLSAIYTSLMDLGFNISNITYDLVNRDELLMEARDLAVKDALAKADMYAKAHGGSVDSLMDLTERGTYIDGLMKNSGVFMIAAYRGTSTGEGVDSMNNRALNDTLKAEIEVSADIDASYYVRQN